MSEDERIRVMVVDDHSIVRVGLAQVLEQSGEFEVVGQAADGEEAVRVAAEVSPDVVVMDVIMPKKDGAEACREIMEANPETRVVMLTASTEEKAVVDAVAAGATGYLQKETDRERLLSAVRRVGPGGASGARCSGEEGVLGDTQRMAGRPRRRRGSDSEGAGDTRLLRPGHVLRPDSGGQGHQGGDGSELNLQHPAEAGGRFHAGPGAVGGAERPAGRLYRGDRAAGGGTGRGTGRGVVNRGRRR